MGFGLYPALVRRFTTERTDPLIFNFYRDLFCFPLLFVCAFIMERKILFPKNLRMLLVSELIARELLV